MIIQCEIHGWRGKSDEQEDCPYCELDALNLAYHDLRKAVGKLLSLSQVFDEHSLERSAPATIWTEVSVAYNKCK